MIRPAEVRRAEVCPAEVCLAEVRLAEVRGDLVLPPSVPGIDTFPEHVQVVWISHLGRLHERFVGGIAELIKLSAAEQDKA